MKRLRPRLSTSRGETAESAASLHGNVAMSFLLDSFLTLVRCILSLLVLKRLLRFDLSPGGRCLCFVFVCYKLAQIANKRLLCEAACIMTPVITWRRNYQVWTLASRSLAGLSPLAWNCFLGRQAGVVYDIGQFAMTF